MKWTRCIVDGCKRRAVRERLFCGFHCLTLSVREKLMAVNARFSPSRMIK